LPPLCDYGNILTETIGPPICHQGGRTAGAKCDLCRTEYPTNLLSWRWRTVFRRPRKRQDAKSLGGSSPPISPCFPPHFKELLEIRVARDCETMDPENVSDASNPRMAAIPLRGDFFGPLVEDIGTNFVVFTRKTESDSGQAGEIDDPRNKLLVKRSVAAAELEFIRPKPGASQSLPCRAVSVLRVSLALIPESSIGHNNPQWRPRSSLSRESIPRRPHRTQDHLLRQCS